VGQIERGGFIICPLSKAFKIKKSIFVDTKGKKRKDIVFLG